MAISFLSRIEFLATPSKQYSLSTAVESRLHELEQKVTFHGEAESSRRNQQDINEDDRKDGHKAIDTRYIETVARTIDGEKATTTREEINIGSRGNDRRSQREVKDHKMMPLDDTIHWIIPNIRIRVVTRKLGSVHCSYTQKGIVMDVENWWQRHSLGGSGEAAGTRFQFNMLNPPRYSKARSCQ
jgi:hypothetical protein